MRSFLCEREKLVVFQIWWFGQVSSVWSVKAARWPCVTLVFALLPCCVSWYPPPQQLGWFKGLISAEAGVLLCMRGGLIWNVRGEEGEGAPVLNTLRITAMNYDLEVGLALSLPLFYHTNKCCSCWKPSYHHFKSPWQHLGDCFLCLQYSLLLFPYYAKFTLQIFSNNICLRPINELQ